jgi:hypothetical protein
MKQEAARGIGAEERVHARVHWEDSSTRDIASKNIGGREGAQPWAGVRQSSAAG